MACGGCARRRAAIVAAVKRVLGAFDPAKVFEQMPPSQDSEQKKNAKGA
jgi:predicted component of type VI protein secretion system